MLEWLVNLKFGPFQQNYFHLTITSRVIFLFTLNSSLCEVCKQLVMTFAVFVNDNKQPFREFHPKVPGINY